MDHLTFMQETAASLSHATAIIGASEVEQQALITSLGISPHDTITLQADELGGIKEVREFATHLLLSPQFGFVRLGIVYSADALTPQAQNALLKLLEEPPERVKIILFIRREARVLATVLSRCRRYRGSQSATIKSESWEKDSLTQFLKAESLAKEENLTVVSEGWLAKAYDTWCQNGRPAAGLDEVLRFWYVYREIEAQVNKRLLLENLVLASLS